MMSHGRCLRPATLRSGRITGLCGTADQCRSQVQGRWHPVKLGLSYIRSVLPIAGMGNSPQTTIAKQNKRMAMPNYAYRVVHTLKGQRVVREHLTPHAFAGTADEFARAMLLDFLTANPALANEFSVVNVWDWDQEGVGAVQRIVARVGTDDLDAEPAAPNLLEIDHYTYYAVSQETDYDFTADDILGVRGADVVHGVPQGLVVPGSGPALKIRTGHQSGFITVDVSVLQNAPAADLSAWDAVEQATLKPRAQVEIRDWLLSAQNQFPDVTGGRRVDYVTVRVSAKGRDAKAATTRRRPLEHHLIEAWPASAPVPREVLKRDETSRYWESLMPAGKPPGSGSK